MKTTISHENQSADMAKIGKRISWHRITMDILSP